MPKKLTTELINEKLKNKNIICVEEYTKYDIKMK